MRKFSGEPSMPLVSTCSAAISANCHRPEADKEAHLLPVQWGATGKNGSGQNLCSFTTSRYVEAPTPGHEYLTYRGASARILDRKIPWKSHILKKWKNIGKHSRKWDPILKCIWARCGGTYHWRLGDQIPIFSSLSSITTSPLSFKFWFSPLLMIRVNEITWIVFYNTLYFHAFTRREAMGKRNNAFYS